MNRWLAAGVVLSVALWGAEAGAAGAAAEAKLQPTKDNSATGSVSFIEEGGKVRVVANVMGLKPGSHGFHVHEKGDCSAPDATSAGGHFNPTGAAHGDSRKGPHHAGDMPMLVADGSGKAQLTVDLDGVSLAQGPTGLIGRAVIVHADPDDYTTQPTGNSGARVACGVIAARR